MEIVGCIALLALCGAGCYGVFHEVKHIKASAEKEVAQTKMYDEILELLKRKG